MPAPSSEAQAALPARFDDLVGRELPPHHATWGTRDAALYALGVGVGQDDATRHLSLTTPDTVQPTPATLPTFATLAATKVGIGHVLDLLRHSGLVADARSMLHGAQQIESVRPLPAAGSAVVLGWIESVWDKGNSTILESVAEVRSAETQDLYCRSRQKLIFRGVGGWGGHRGSSLIEPSLSNEPDEVLRVSTRLEQALLYRLSGDLNPLHTDPAVARTAGFERPILHGLCLFGVVGRVLLSTFADADPARLAALGGRFARPTYPGDSLDVRVWRPREPLGDWIFDVQSSSRMAVMSGGTFRMHGDESPQNKELK